MKEKKQKKAAEKYFKLKLKNWEGKLKPIDVHGYLMGIIVALRVKMNLNYHGLIIVTGDMGDGKSSMSEGLFGLYNHISGVESSINDVQWTTEKINELMDSRENIDHAIWWDELIQAGGNRGKLTKEGKKFQMKYITNRWKKNLYIVCIDSLDNCPDYLIKYADVWINCEAPGWNRGFFKATSNKYTIKYCYDLFHKFKKTWASPEVKSVHFDCYGRSDDFGGFFINPNDYLEAKSRETMETEDEEVEQKPKFIPTPQMILAYNLNKYEKITKTKLAEQLDVSRNTITEWVKKMDIYLHPPSYLNA